MMTSQWCMPWASLMGRILIGGMFVMAGVQKFLGLAGTAAYIASVGLPSPELLAPLVGTFEVVAGLSLILGYKIEWSAGALVIFTTLASVLFHSNFADLTQMAFFIKNMAIIGGLLYIVSFGAGPLSLERKPQSQF